MAGKYEADGTIHVRYGSCGTVKSATFVPLQYTKQGGSKFVVFVPWNDSESSRQEITGRAEKSLVVRVDESNGTTKGVKLFGAEKFGVPLLHEAIHIKVTVVVSVSPEMDLALEEITIPALPTTSSTG